MQAQISIEDIQSIIRKHRELAESYMTPIDIGACSPDSQEGKHYIAEAEDHNKIADCLEELCECRQSYVECKLTEHSDKIKQMLPLVVSEAVVAPDYNATIPVVLTDKFGYRSDAYFDPYRNLLFPVAYSAEAICRLGISWEPQEM